MASALKSLPVLVGAGTGAFVGKQFGNKPLIGAGVGLALGLFVLARLNQGPSAEAGAFGRLTPVPAFKSSTKAVGAVWTEADTRNPTAVLVGAIGRARVRSKSELGVFITNAILTANKETNTRKGSGRFKGGPLLAAIRPIPEGKFQKGGEGARQAGPVFGQLRRALIAGGASMTQRAVRDAAAWFYRNVEGPSVARSIESGVTDLVGGAAGAAGGVPAAEDADTNPSWWSRQTPLAKGGVIFGGLAATGLLAVLLLRKRPR
jgi:hypothetical protein